ncbi:unnamed protein product [Rodentolepis nana]|uniref:E3 ubiquitin-protein ligase PPP1R11 n=1 Tax=Rodentolepis nana TaxID=102285 RepID=A0A0R3TFU2_RODNA|nr:unnamed protein product [Rodentolepis nana]
MEKTHLIRCLAGEDPPDSVSSPRDKKPTCPLCNLQEEMVEDPPDSVSSPRDKKPTCPLCNLQEEMDT